MPRVVGIDLGTTNSCVAVIDGDAPVVIANAESTIYAVKRLMGRKFEDPEVQRHVLTCPYEVVAADNGDAHVRIRGRDYSPPEVSALVLQKMRQTAEDWIG